jgi:hypothetical protein
MSAYETWQETNERWLAAAMEHVRLRLDRQARRTAHHAPPETADASEARERIDAALAAMHAAEAEAMPPAAIVLARRLGLSTFDLDTLMLCVAQELDTTVRARCAAAQDDPLRPYPTFALALAISDAPAWDVMAPDAPLRRWRLIEISQPGAQPLTVSALRADERIVNYVKGLNDLDDRLSALVEPVAPVDPNALPESQRAVAARVAAELAAAGRAMRPVPPVRLVGGDRAGKLEVAGAIAARLGLRAYRLAAEYLPAQGAELEQLARLWHRECLLLPLALVIETRGAAEASGAAVARFAGRTGGIVLVDEAPGRSVALDHALTVPVDKPTPAEQRDAWLARLGDADTAAALAAQFHLGLAELREIAAHHAGGAPLDALWAECRRRTRPAIESLAQPIDAKATFDDIVLPPAEAALLRQIAAQVRVRARVYDEWGFRDRMNRGLGISVLFAGDSGTGKTMAAEVVANALDLDLFRIDLSAVVSKYIGETEKNLRQVFDAAEAGGAILFFDEADALFGKRSEVRDSHDRYANIEVNYLLQRMEGYRGLAILATNMKSALDAAFTRRLRFIVNFPFPGPAERKEMWRKALPARVPRGAIDYERLARLHLTGGNIHSVALNAAFLAAQAGMPVNMGLLLEASRLELRKLDRPVNEADFRWTEPAGAGA